MDAMKLVDKALRMAKEKRINQAELARLIGVPPSRVSEWKNDEGKPSVDHALRMAKVVGTTLDYLADDELDEPPAPSSLEPDEQFILQLFRDLRLSRDEAARRLAMASDAHDGEFSANEPGVAHRVPTRPRVKRGATG